ncbi:carboxylesterase/lipase family protein [Treponema bryantii]|uniref:carboxylesterase/lipase family protein n=1 Tax=Treponema bryantii TaxID=163 RepID=UPI0003B3F731|nr:carboxylesterase family protein [Treponema bryantii]
MKTRIKLITFLSILLILSSCASTNLKKTNPTGLKEQTRTEVITVTGGDVRGIVNKDGTVEIFAGLPFAAPPVGDLRWKEPQDVIPWKGILEADHFAPMAMQLENGPVYNFLFNAYTHSKKSRTYGGPMSEDCLYLNVWRPVGKAPQGGWPVLVYVHGGTLLTGQSWYEKYDGENLAANGIIVVNIAYRVGVFGYFADAELAKESPNGTTGNYGLLDQIKALEWVHNNIAAFGGDAGNVTIAGESAGSSSVNALCASPLTKGFFRRAIGESSSVIQQTPPHTFRTMEAALKMGDDIKKEFGCKNMEELRTLPAAKLIKTKYKNSSMTVDGYALPETPYEIYQKGLNHEEALMNGFNKREAFGFTFFTKVDKKNIASLLEPSMKDKSAAFLEKYGSKNKKELKSLYNDVFSAVCFTYPHDQWTKTLQAQGKPVYEYYFSRENGEIGTNHSGEMIYAYRNVPHTKNYKARDYELEEIMSSYWLNFVKYGNPNGKDTAGKELPLWQTSKESGGLLMEFGDSCSMVEDPFAYIYDYLN